MKVIQNIFGLVSEMKRKPRTGHVDHKVRMPETVWQHSVEVRSISYKLGWKYLGPKHARHCEKLGAVHDIIEGIVPDITPQMGFSTAQKQELEMLAINHIGTFSDGGARIRDLWLEYEDGKTPPAKLVKKIDKLQLVYPVLKYERTNASPFSLQIFWDYARKHVEETPLIEIWEALSQQRPQIYPPKPVLELHPAPPGTFEKMKKRVLYRIGQCEVG